MSTISTWRENLQIASYKGIEFFIFNADDTMGRRTVKHEYPSKDVPYVEDMGAVSRVVSFSAFVIGEDYLDKRNALEKVLNEKGSGTLVHPYYGSIRVNLHSEVKVSHTAENGGMCVFSLEFIRIEEAKDAYANATVNTLWQVENRVINALSSIATLLQNNLEIFSFGDYVKQSVENYASAELSNIAFRLAQKDNSENFATSFYEDDQSIGSSYVSSMQDTLITSENPSSLDIISVSDTQKKVHMPSKIGTSQRAIKNSQKAFLDASKQSIYVLLLYSFASYVPSTREEFVYLSDKSIELYDDIALNYCIDDNLLAELSDLRIYALKMLSAAAGKIPYVLSVNLLASRPVLELSYFYLGNLSAEDIASKNNIEHPAFIPGGINIEVLKAV